MPSRESEWIRHLATAPLFAGLGDDELARIASHALPITLRKGAALFGIGDTPRGFYVTMTGQIKVSFVSPRGDEKVVDLFGPGQSFGEAVAFLARPAPVNAQAVVSSSVLLIPVGPVLDEIRRDGHYAARVIAGLCRRVHALTMELESHLMHSGTQRVAAYLLGEAGAGTGAGNLPGGAAGREIRLPAAKGVVASRLGMTQEHFSRILGELGRQELIAVQGRGVRLLDAERLRAFVV